MWLQDRLLVKKFAWNISGRLVLGIFLRWVRRFAENILPVSFSRFMVALYGVLKPPVKSYSQKGEDILVGSFFSYKKSGYYLDIGCFHPKWISNTYMLHKKGWSGTVVDIDNYKLDAFKFFRGNKVNTLKGAVVGDRDEAGEATVYRFRSSLGWSDIDTLDREVAEYKRKTGWGEYIEDQISIIPINALLSELPHVDFLNIDVEGIDSEVIEALDLERFRIEVILFEDNIHLGGGIL